MICDILFYATGRRSLHGYLYIHRLVRGHRRFSSSRRYLWGVMPLFMRYLLRRKNSKSSIHQCLILMKQCHKSGLWTIGLRFYSQFPLIVGLLAGCGKLRPASDSHPHRHCKERSDAAIQSIQISRRRRRPPPPPSLRGASRRGKSRYAFSARIAISSLPRKARATWWIVLPLPRYLLE